MPTTKGPEATVGQPTSAESGARLGELETAEQPIHEGPTVKPQKYTLLLKVGSKWTIYEHADLPDQYIIMGWKIQISPEETHCYYAPEMTLFSFVESDDLNLAGIGRILKTRDANFPDVSSMLHITCED